MNSKEALEYLFGLALFNADKEQHKKCREANKIIQEDLEILEIIKKYENVIFIKDGNTFKIILSSEKITQEEQNKVRDGLVND